MLKLSTGLDKAKLSALDVIGANIMIADAQLNITYSMDRNHTVRIGDVDVIVSVQELELGSWMATANHRNVPYAARARAAELAFAALVQVLKSEE